MSAANIAWPLDESGREIWPAATFEAIQGGLGPPAAMGLGMPEG